MPKTTLANMKLVELPKDKLVKKDTTPDDELEEADVENVQAPVKAATDVGGSSLEAAPS